jgi:outer membrane protein OmpA-like peptidoglycan-associated protein
MKHLIAFPALALLTACSTPQDTYQNWFSEVGAELDRTGQFGAATAHNTAIQNGEKAYTTNMGTRFAAEVDTTITFAFNSASLDSAARETLRQQADWIKQFPEVRFNVYGHTDAVGSDAYNKRLGKRRANAVVNYFASQGISRDRLEALVSFGETQPVIDTQDRERQNRRTVTEVSGFVSGHPNVLDGKYAAIIYREYIASAAPLPTGAVPSTNE